MNKILFSFYRALVPKPLRTIILKKSLRRKILAWFASLPENKINEEQRAVLEYLENNPVAIFPYAFQADYSAEKIGVFYDPGLGMRYVMHDGKRLYFKKRWSEKRIKRAYSDLLREQDAASPHRYLTGDFDIQADDVVADIGAAEGNFSLSVVERAKKIYLFEYDREWAEALRATFSPWKEKVEIINKYLSPHDDSSNIRFDTFYKDKGDVTFLKIDVDGAESSVLESCREVFNSGKAFRIALCTYHKNNDEKDFTVMLGNNGFTVTPSGGYMIHYYDKKMKAPYLRRGLVRAVRR